MVAAGVALSGCASKPRTEPATSRPAPAGPSSVSFESRDYDWKRYGDEMVERIKGHWNVPELARLGWKGQVSLSFTILRDGSVDRPEVLTSSMVRPFDAAALDAIVRSSPFARLPDDFPRDHERVTIHFFYNMRPGNPEPTPVPMRR